MSTTPQFVGIDARTNTGPNVLSAALQALKVGLRVAIPCEIISFNATLQTVTARPLITENVKVNGVVTPTQIPDLLDVPLLILSDQNFCLTFPNLVGTECLVIFADMCFNSWWANGNVQNQERIRRHSLSDGFAILSPKSQPNKIASYSTTRMELRSLNGDSLLGMDNSGNVTLEGNNQVVVTSPGNVAIHADSGSEIKLDGTLDITATVTAATYANISNSIPVKVNGVQYYIKLSTSP